MDAGQQLAGCNLALMTIVGIGVPQDREAGLRLLEASAAGGTVEAAEALFNLYFAGEHVPRSPELAAHWLERAADLGSAAAACALADWLIEGKIVARDRDRARVLL